MKDREIVLRQTDQTANFRFGRKRCIREKNLSTTSAEDNFKAVKRLPSREEFVVATARGLNIIPDCRSSA